MDAIEFVMNYEKFLLEIELVIKSEFLTVLEELKETDPHDLITPETWFVSSNHARGFVWTLFISKYKNV